VEVKGLLIGGGASGLGDGAATNAFKVDDGVGCLVNLLLTKCAAGLGPNATEPLQIAARKVFCEINLAPLSGLPPDKKKYVQIKNCEIMVALMIAIEL